jgi:cytidyltransferase-like protein
MYPRVLVAGTFDSLHDGHEELLTRSCEAGERVTIWLTSDAFVKKYKPGQTIQPFQVRKTNVQEWLNNHGFSQKSTVESIDDPYEPAISIKMEGVLVVTPENKARGEEINTKRKAAGLPPHALLLVGLVPAEDQKPISSTRVRNGEIDHSGRLIMPDNLRPELGEPLGEILVGDRIGSSIEKYRSSTVITVGDVTTSTFLTAGVIPKLIIVDFRVARQPFPENDVKLAQLNLYRVHVVSGPGFIAEEAVEAIKKWSTHATDTTVLVVDGEEDLLALPAIAYGPIGALVYYGQPDKGLVEVIITEEKRNGAVALLTKFT